MTVPSKKNYLKKLFCREKKIGIQLWSANLVFAFIGVLQAQISTVPAQNVSDVQNVHDLLHP